MKILIKSACIIDSQSSFNNQTASILIENGIISKIAKDIAVTSDVTVIELDDLHVSQGWFDSSVAFGEPGYEERETINNGLQTSALSGFSCIAINPDTKPLIDNSTALSFLNSKSALSATKLLAVGNLTTGAKGVDLAELFDMQSHGACCFYDYKKPIKNPNLLKIALQYAQGFNGLVQSFPLEKAIAGNGIVNENISSTQLGLKGIPALAEELQIARDLFILEYTGGKLHIPTISTLKSAELIKAAKVKGLNVSCSVAAYNLILDDSYLQEFDTNYKVLPPLRTKNDCKALIEAVIDGTIDMITSDHRPMDIENKQVEFDNAYYGSIGLESVFGALNTVLPLEIVIKKLTEGKQRFGEPLHSIEEGNKADLSLFTPNATYTFSKEDILSTNLNSMFLNQKLKGKAYGIVANNQIAIS